MRISDWSSDVCLPIWRLRCLDPKVAGSYCPASRAPLPPKYFLGVTVNQAWGQIATELYCVAKKHHRAAATIAAHSASSITRIPRSEIGRAHVWTPVTNAHLVCRLLL